jgi:hypothetical protein
MASSTVTPATGERTLLMARWALVVLWVTMPFVIGPALAEALAERSEAVQRVDSIAAWLLWGLGVVATLVPSTVSLTTVRVLVPAAVAAAGAALVAGASTTTGLVAAAAGLITAAVAMQPGVGHVFANGSSYGDERRYLLRPPAALFLGPIELAWAALVAGVVTGPMLLAAQAWVAGGAALVVGWPVAALVARSLHGLTRRWLVFVPAGLVVHDYSTLVESAMVQRREIARVARAEPGTDAADLTGGAFGATVQLDFSVHVPVTPRPADRPGSGTVAESQPMTSILVAPTRTAAVLREATARRLPVAA